MLGGRPLSPGVLGGLSFTTGTLGGHGSFNWCTGRRARLHWYTGRTRLCYWGGDGGALLVRREDRVFFFTSIPEIWFLTGVLGGQVGLTGILGRRGLFLSVLGGRQSLTGILGGWGDLLVYWEEGEVFSG